MQTNANDTELLTTDQAAQLLAVKPSTLTTWRCTKAVEIPYVKIGHLARYKKADLLRFIEDHLHAVEV